MEKPDLPDRSAPELKNKNKAKKIRDRGEEPVRQALYRMSAVDLTSIDAVGAGAAQAVLSEYGPDLSRFPSERSLFRTYCWRREEA